MTEEILKTINITKSAIEHFSHLLEQEEEGTNLRIFVSEPYTQRARVGVTYCPKDCQKDNDTSIEISTYTLFVDGSSIEALKDAKIDYENSEFGGQLSIKAPNMKGQKPKDDGPLEERLKYFIDNEINPQLSMHGGMVSLVKIENNAAILQFGGGCQGCSMVDATLKYGIEQKFKENFPEIEQVIDVTEHSTGENPYYK